MTFEQKYAHETQDGVSDWTFLSNEKRITAIAFQTSGLAQNSQAHLLIIKKFISRLLGALDPVQQLEFCQMQLFPEKRKLWVS